MMISLWKKLILDFNFVNFYKVIILMLKVSFSDRSLSVVRPYVRQQLLKLHLL